MVPISPEQACPSSNGTEVGSRSLAPPKVSLCVKDHGSDVDSLEDAAARILHEVESRRKSGAFPILESLTDIDQKRETYLGPTMESNWVLPGKLLVGAYPASMNDSHHAHLLCTILFQGVSTFICLQQEYRAHGVTEAMWRSGEALRPYFQDVLQLLRKLQELRETDPHAVPPVSAPDSTNFVHFPIVDCNVADDTKVLQLAAQLALRVAEGEVLYLHCWGGHGRTGTVVSIMLHLMYGLGAEESMERCQHVHDVRRIPISVGSPQTEAQREQVRRVISRLIKCSPSAVTSVSTSPISAPTPAPASHGVSKSVTMANPPTSGTTVVHEEQRLPKTKAVSAKPVTWKVPTSNESHGLSHSQDTAGASGVGRTTAACEGTNRGGDVGQTQGGEQTTSPVGVGGRRGWVRGRREAFAPAPNGIGEEVPGWALSEETTGLSCVPPKASGTGKCKVEGVVAGAQPIACPDGVDEGNVQAQEGNVGVEESSTADNGTGRRLRPRTSSWQREDEADALSALGQGSSESPHQLSASGDLTGDCRNTSGRSRRKSFMDPPSQGEEDPFCGARSNRLRRKSAPGQSPRSAERDHLLERG